MPRATASSWFEGLRRSSLRPQATTGEVRHVAGEFPTPKDRDGSRCLARFVDDLDLAGPDDEELEVAFADPDEGLPGPVLLEGRPGAMPQRGHLGLVELRGREHRVHRVAPRG